MDFQAAIKTATIKQSVWTVAATGVNGALGAGFYFLLARWLGSWEYGAFSLVATIVAGLASIVDLGCDQALVRFVPRYKSNPAARYQVMKLALEIKIIMGIFTAFILTIAARPVSVWVFDQPSLSHFLPLAGLGVITQLLFTYSISWSQALEKFAWWSGILVGTNLTRLIIILALFSVGILNSQSTVVTYILTPFLGFVAAWLVTYRQIWLVKGEWQRVKDFWQFNPGVVAFTVVAVVGSRIDTVLTARLIDLSAVGVYSLANQITSILPQLTGAVGAVTSPKFASFDSPQSNLSYTTKALQLAAALAAVTAMGIIPLAWLVIRFSGSDYLTAWGPLLPLLVAMVIFLASSPLRDSIIYYFGKPNFFTWTGIVHTLQTVVLGLWWIPHWGVVGAGYSVLAGQITIALMVIGYWWYKHTQDLAS